MALWGGLKPILKIKVLLRVKKGKIADNFGGKKGKIKVVNQKDFLPGGGGLFPQASGLRQESTTLQFGRIIGVKESVRGATLTGRRQ